MFALVYLEWINHMSYKNAFLLGVIMSLAKSTGRCFASNSYLMKKMNCERRTLQDGLAFLKQEGYIEVEFLATSQGQSTRYINITQKAFAMSVATTAEQDYQDEGLEQATIWPAPATNHGGVTHAEVRTSICENPIQPMRESAHIIYNNKINNNKRNILSTQNSKNEVEKGDVVENDFNPEMNEVNLPLETTIIYDEEKKPTPKVPRAPLPLKGSQPLKNQKALDDFNQFWAMYPRKTAKPAALKAWLSKKPDITTVLTALEKAKQGWVKDKTDQKYIPHPSTWINQERYNDEDPTPDVQNCPKTDEWWS